MNVKRFIAPSMEAALAKVKSSFGRDAVILHTRCFNSGGLFGIGGRRMVEVTACEEAKVPARGGQPRRRALEQAYRPIPAPSENLASLRNDIAGLKAMIDELSRRTRPSRSSFWPEELKGWLRHLRKRGVGETTALEILEPLAPHLAGGRRMNPEDLKRMVMERVRRALKTAEPIGAGAPGRPSVVALVGPTGVGKTTTIAKLAAHFVLREGQSVGLVTLDTYRIAAVEQLKTYARIIDVPLEVALSPSDLQGALDRLSDRSLVFIDTAGRSQRDAMKMNDLKNFFGARRPDQIHLVLSATAERCAIAQVVEKFAMYAPDRLLITKLDELPACGKLLDISRMAPVPVSYLTTGQDVPDDIETARPERLAALIAGEDEIDC